VLREAILPRRDWRLRIDDILEAIEKIGTYTRGMTQEGFAEDSKTVDAVVRKASCHVEESILRAAPGQCEDTARPAAAPCPPSGTAESAKLWSHQL
jgi:hypothetical protein